MLDVFNAVSGMSESPFNFVPKVILEEKFYPDVKSVRTIEVIFMAIIPIAVVATGITVWVVRKRR